MADFLPDDVTIATLVGDGRLYEPARYLRRALANLLDAGDFGTVTLRIGRTGGGKEPSYVLEQGAKSLGRFDGKTHEAWSGLEGHDDKNWSSKRTTGAELHELWKSITF